MRDKIIAWLEKILENYKNDNLSEENKKLITEFFVSYQYANIEKTEENTEKENLKYFYLGWYIYNNIDSFFPSSEKNL